MSSQTKKVPVAALKLGLEPLQFASEDGQAGKFPLKMRARGGQPLYHWYWGAIVHDMAGFEPDHPVIPVDWCHTDDLMGALNKFKPSNDGLDVEGFLAKVRDDDRVSEVKAKSDLGVPYQASIFFDPKSIEEVAAGSSAKVNGYELAGPATIIRQWSLRGVAICPYGYDNQTNSKFAAGDDQGEIEVPLTLTAMSKKPNTPAAGEGQPATELSAPAGEQKPTELSKPASETKPEGETKPAATELKKPSNGQEKLKKFVAKFGAENGSKWFGEGKSTREALELHVEELQNQLTKKDKDIAELKTRLEAAKPGEEKPVTFTDGEPKGGSAGATKEKSHLGSGVAKFAAGIKLPGKNK